MTYYSGFVPNPTVLPPADLGGVTQQPGALIVSQPSGDTTGATDTVTLQNALNAGGLVQLKPGSTYYLSAPLYIGKAANTVLQAYEATITEGSNFSAPAAGVDCLLLDYGHWNMLVNSLAWTAPVGCKLYGGFWLKTNPAGTGNGLHTIVLGGSYLVCRDVKITTTVGKYGILIQNAINFDVGNITFGGTNSDGVHIQGPASQGTIENIKGTTADDLVAITPLDYALYTWGNEGDVTDILIDGVFPVLCPTNAVKVLSANNGAALNTKRIKIRNVSGSMTAGVTSGIYIGDDTGSANTQNGNLDDVLIDGVSLTGVTSTVPYISLAGSATSVTIPKITIRNISVQTDCTAVVQNNTKVTSLIVDGVQGQTLTAAPTAIVNFGNNAWVACSRLELSNVDMLFAAVGGSVVHAITVGQTLGDVFVSDAYVTSSAWLADVITSTNFYIKGVRLHSNGSGIFNVRSPAAVVVQGCDGLLADGTTSSTITATGTLESKAPEMILDVGNAQVVKNKGDMCTNRNALALYGGTGKVLVSDGTTWRGMDGYLNNGTAVLVAGTVTVADVNITANSEIKLYQRTPGGTQGAPYISALTAGTGFTITSTSALDTSTVYYEIVRY